MTKVVINTCYGGFALSEKAMLRLRELGLPEAQHGKFIGETYHNSEETIGTFCGFLHDTERNDPLLVQVVEELGDEANGKFSKLKVVEVDDDVKWEIDDYDGNEEVREVSRRWS